MSAKLKRYENRLGIKGWLGGGRWGIDRYAYTLHRVTGLAILGYFLLHICVTALRVKGIYLWTKGQMLDHRFFQVGEFLIFLCFAFHAMNGLRLVLVELGLSRIRLMTDNPKRLIGLRSFGLEVVERVPLARG